MAQCGALLTFANKGSENLNISVGSRRADLENVGKNQGNSYVKRIVIALGLVAGMIMTASAQTPEVSPPDTAPIHLPNGVQKGFDLYQTVAVYDFRAFAFYPVTGKTVRSWFQQTPKHAIDDAVNGCERSGGDCTLYALGDTIVWGMSPDRITTVAGEYYTAVSPAMAQARPSSFIGKRLSSDEITMHLSDVSVEGTNSNGLKYKGAWLSNGTMSATATLLHIIEITPADSGTWAVSDNKLCRQWRHWSGGRWECLIVTKDDHTIHAYDAHGDQIEKLRLFDKH